ncbi:MAG: energy transducer TonB [Pseudomonadota bacterium]
MSYAEQQRGLTPVKLVGLILALTIVSLALVGMALGLTIEKFVQEVERVTTIDIEEPPPPEEIEEPPPPPEQETQPPPPVAPPPPINIAPAPPPIQTQPTIPPPAPIALEIPPQAPVAAPAPPPSQARGATTRNERRWAARIQENYPSRALRQGVEGTVGVRVTVTPDGRATGCSVTASSGSPVLDQAACRGMERYSRFNPALDDAGNETTGVYSTRITYRLN